MEVILLNIETLFLYFFIYSLLGWCMETVFCRICQGKWTDRGFFYGPYCPIYGVGALCIVILLQPFSLNPFLTFILAFFLTSLLEYVTSYVLEKIFNATWWDYSHLPFNLQGRICLINSILFALLSMFLIYMIHPQIINFVDLISVKLRPYIALSLLIVMIADLVSTLYTIISLKEKLGELADIGESIEDKKTNRTQNSEIVKQLQQIKLNIMNRTSIYHQRLIEAFPSLKFKKFNNVLQELKVLIHQKQWAKKRGLEEKQLNEKNED